MKRNRMIYPILTLTAAALLPACASGPGSGEHLTCPSAPDVRVRYGDSYLDVDARKQVKPGCKLDFLLLPRSTRGPNGVDYADVKVTIKGKEGPDGAHWIVFSNTAANTPRRRFSASSPPNQAEGTYYYLVEVETVGMLDPRIDVER